MIDTDGRAGVGRGGAGPGMSVKCMDRRGKVGHVRDSIAQIIGWPGYPDSPDLGDIQNLLKHTTLNNLIVYVKYY